MQETTPSEHRVVGRNTELAVFRQMLGRASSGQGGFLLYVGEQGIGRTALLDEIRDEAARGDTLSLTAVATRGPFSPWKQLVEDLLARAGRDVTQRLLDTLGESARDLALLIPRVGTMMSIRPDVLEGADGKAERDRSSRALADLFVAAAETAALCVVADDVHEWDSSSTRVLEEMASKIQNSRVLIVASCDKADVETREILSSVAKVEALTPLSDLHIREIVTARLGRLVHESVVAAIVAESAGNPSLATLYATDLLQRNKDPREAIGPDDLQIPPEGEAAALNAIRLLPPGARSVAQVAALIGRTFHADLLSAAGGWPAAFVQRALTHLAAAGVVREEVGRPGAYAFRHRVHVKALVDSLEGEDLARWSMTVAKVLEAENDDRFLADIQRCYRQAGACDKAIDALLELCRGAIAATAYEDSVQRLQAALDDRGLMSGVGDRERYQIFDLLGRSSWCLGDAQRAVAAFGAAVRLAPDVKSKGRTVVAWGEVWTDFTADKWPLPTMYSETLDELPPDEASLEVQLLAQGGKIMSWSGSLERGVERTDAAVGLAEGLGDASALARALVEHHHALWHPRHRDERSGVADRAERTARLSGDAALVLDALMCRFLDALEAGDTRAAKSLVAEYAREAEALRRPTYSWLAMNNRAVYSLMVGDFEGAKGLALSTRDLGQLVLPQASAQIHAVQELIIHWQLGDLANAFAKYEEFTENLADVTLWEITKLWLRAALADKAGDESTKDELRPTLRSLVAASLAQRPRLWLGEMALLSKVCQFLQDSENAARIYEAIEPYADVNVVVGWPAGSLGPVSRYLSVLSRAMGRLDDAVSHLEHAVDMSERMGAQPIVVRAKVQLADLLLERGARGDYARAGEMLPNVRYQATRLGMGRVSRDAADLLERLRKLQETPPLGLKEREVWALGYFALRYKHAEVAPAMNVALPTAKSYRRDAVAKVRTEGGRELGRDPAQALEFMESHPYCAAILARITQGEEGKRHIAEP